MKTGSSASLSKRERALRKCINERRVRYETIHQLYDAADNQMLDMKRT
ncbi:MAG: Holliday junction resolvase-like protein [Methanomicrobiales archaeon]